jgi:site-specific recombinase XerD
MIAFLASHRNIRASRGCACSMTLFEWLFRNPAALHRQTTAPLCSYRSLIRRFLAYWFARRQINRIPEPEQKPNIGTRFFPYVYSKAEIARLLAAAPVCQVSRRCTIGSSTLSAIILFLYGTGLRVTEALSYRAQLACLDVRTIAPDLASRPAKSDEECS